MKKSTQEVVARKTREYRKAGLILVLCVLMMVFFIIGFLLLVFSYGS